MASLKTTIFSLLGSLPYAVAADRILPQIAIIATGGTIAGQATDTTATTGYSDSTVAVNQLIAAVPEIYNISRPLPIQYSNLGSENINSTVTLGLSKLVNELIANGTADGIVITHGTDTLEETAMFLDLTYNGTRPVAMVAAMRPGGALSADGPFNLVQGVGLAASESAANRGVTIVLNDRIGSAMYTTKTNARALDAFKAYEQGYLGVFLDENPMFYYGATRHSNQPYFDVSEVDSLPKVTILYGYQEMDVEILRSVVRTGTKGIVVACVGDGSLPSNWVDTARNLTRAGIPVVRASRTGQSFLGPKDDALTSGHYNPQKARILLQLVLQKYGGENATLIQEFFNP